jgi:hypothetical protein
MPGPVNTWERNYDVGDGTSRRSPSNAPGPAEQRSPGVWARGAAVYEAYTRALILAPAAILSKTGYALGEVLKGLLPGFLQALVVLGVTTVVGAAAGGSLGFFFGGAGAAPGVVLGGELGLDIGTAALSWLGVGFLAVAITMGLGELWATVSRGIECAWAAPEHPQKEYPHQIEQAAQDLADAVGIVMLLILQAIVATILKRAAVGSSEAALATGRSIGSMGSEAAADEAVVSVVRQLRGTKLGSGFADWVEENWPRLRDDPRLRFRGRAPEEGGGPGTTHETSAPAGKGAAPEGLAYRIDLPDHLLGPDGFKGGKLYGTHNLNNAIASLKNKNASCSLSPTSTTGISELGYRYFDPSRGKYISGTKTVYDPIVYNDETMLNMAQKAGEQGFENYLKNPADHYDVIQDGVKFRVYINTDTNTGAPYVGNVHPIP